MYAFLVPRGYATLTMVVNEPDQIRFNEIVYKIE